MHHHPEKPARWMDPGTAVIIGHAWVSAPMLGIVLLGTLAGIFLYGILGMLVAFPVSIALGWLWWSFFIPRWRRWARRRGADPERLQYHAELTGLVWPKGFILERTEFRLKDD